MQEIYTGKRETTVLEYGAYNGYIYEILSLGTHPTAYVAVKEGHKFWGKGYTEIAKMQDIEVHGGLTFTGHFDEGGKLFWWLGWDYAHLGDFYDHEMLAHRGGKRYTLDMIRADVFSVVNQILKGVYDEHRQTTFTSNKKQG